MHKPPQVRSYLYAKYAAAYTLSQYITLYDVTICNKILTQCTGILKQTPNATIGTMCNI